MLYDMFVIHGVAYASAIKDMSCAVVDHPPSPDYALTREAIARE